jgi:hypothetical protein
MSLKVHSFGNRDDFVVDNRRPNSFLEPEFWFLGGGSDTLQAFGGYDQVFAGPFDGADGDDVVSVEGLGNFVQGAAGDDIITFQRTAPRGFDPATADRFRDRNAAEGGDGDDFISGSFYNDFLLGGDGDDTLLGFGGDDTIDGGSGRNTIRAGAGDDVVAEGFGDSPLDAGTDVIFLGAGDDRVSLGADLATDVATLGSGRDTVVMQSGGVGYPAGLGGPATDRVTDFVAGSGGDRFEFDLRGNPYLGPVITDPLPFVRLAQTREGAVVAFSLAAFEETSPFGESDDLQVIYTVLLEGVVATDLTAENFSFIALDRGGPVVPFDSAPEIVRLAALGVDLVFTG